MSMLQAGIVLQTTGLAALSDPLPSWCGWLGITQLPRQQNMAVQQVHQEGAATCMPARPAVRPQSTLHRAALGNSPPWTCKSGSRCLRRGCCWHLVLKDGRWSGGGELLRQRTHWRSPDCGTCRLHGTVLLLCCYRYRRTALQHQASRVCRDQHASWTSPACPKTGASACTSFCDELHSSRAPTQTTHTPQTRGTQRGQTWLVVDSGQPEVRRAASANHRGGPQVGPQHTQGHAVAQLGRQQVQPSKRPSHAWSSMHYMWAGSFSVCTGRGPGAQGGT